MGLVAAALFILGVSLFATVAAIGLSLFGHTVVGERWLPNVPRLAFYLRVLWLLSEPTRWWLLYLPTLLHHGFDGLYRCLREQRRDWRNLEDNIASYRAQRQAKLEWEERGRVADERHGQAPIRQDVGPPPHHG